MSGGTRVTESRSEPWEFQSPYLESGFGEAGRLYNAGAPAYYGGPTVAGFDTAEQAAQAGTLGYALGPEAREQQLAAQSSLVQGLSGQVDPAAYSPLASALATGVQSKLTGEVLPGIRESLVRYQPGGSTRGDLVQNKAIADAVTTGMTQPLAEMYTSAYGRAQDRAVQSGQMYPSIMGAPMGLYGAAADVGSQRRAMTQEGINRDMARYQYEANAEQQQLANYMNMISGNYGGTTTMTTPGPSGFSQLTGLLGAVAPLFAPSDIQVKENIIPDGTWKGYNVYRFNYIGDTVRRRGVMAQEVEKIRPDAVVEFDGIKHVNYGEV